MGTEELERTEPGIIDTVKRHREGDPVPSRRALPYWRFRLTWTDRTPADKVPRPTRD